MEKQIDEWEADIAALNNFILPGGHPSGAAFHVARTVVRRAERNAVPLGEEVNPLVLVYLKRLSDLLFVAARFANHHLGSGEQSLHAEKS